MRFYFDVEGPKAKTQDEEGLTFESPAAARDAALGALTQIGADEITKDAMSVSITVRDESRRPLYRADLVVREEWIVEKPESLGTIFNVDLAPPRQSFTAEAGAEARTDVSE